jgi:putative phosphoesterase
MSVAATPRDVVQARRIGFLSDTHFMDGAGADVPRPLFAALTGVELIVHLGHISSPGALDRLETLAPVLAVSTDLDDKLFGERMASERQRGRVAGRTCVIEAGGLRIGAVHDLVARVPGMSLGDDSRLVFPDAPLAEALAAVFGGPVDVVAFAATHVEQVLSKQGVLFVNPGSPNLPAGRRKDGPGTVCILDGDRGAAAVEIVEVAAA